MSGRVMRESVICVISEAWKKSIASCSGVSDMAKLIEQGIAEKMRKISFVSADIGGKTKRSAAARGNEEFHERREQDAHFPREMVVALNHDARRDRSQHDEGAGEVMQHGVDECAAERNAECLQSKSKERAVKDGRFQCAEKERGEGNRRPRHHRVAGGAER